ncbi:MAG: hypothetical protein C0490_03120 [Marivirga sp.]|nr:hypothetical protein [Marivirga sp.]
MNLSCPPAPLQKREYIADIGKILINDFGKKKYYKPQEIKKAHEKSTWNGGLDFSCWAMSTYSSHSDFDEYHEKTGEVYDYSEMKAEMLEGISLTDAVHVTDFPDADLDASWLDMGEVFGGVLEGIGEFFAAVADGL